MEKLKLCSFYFNLNIKKYFIFLFIAVAIFANGFFISYIDADDSVIIPTEISSDITENTHWTIVGSPYIINTTIFINDGAILTIDPGVVVKFDGGSLIVNGKLEALGTESSPIYLTSFYDDTVGGDTDGVEENCYFNTDEEGNNIGEEICDPVPTRDPSSGDWNYIFIWSQEQSILNNVIQRYSSDELMIYNGGSVTSTNYTSDKGVLVYGESNASFSGLNIPLIEIYQNSNVSISNSTISNSINNDPSIWVFSGGSLDIRDSNIGGYDGLIFYNNSSVTADNLSIDCNNNGIEVSVDSSLVFNNGNIFCGNNGVLAYNDAIVDISNSKISGASNAGIMTYFNTDPDAIKITKSEITGNKNGILLYFTDISAHQNNIHDNNSYGAITYDTDPVTIYNYDFSSNFWGDKTGPTHTSNPTGIGDTISDNIIYTPFLTTDPLLPPTKNPVILIPGITGTYLYRDYGDKDEIWPDINRLLLPFGDTYLEDLNFNQDGMENIEFPIVKGDIIRGINLPIIDDAHIFDNLINEFTSSGYIEGTDLFVFPYDWRMSSRDNAILLKNKIDEVLLNSESDKVDIVAHSMGGLIAKKYIAGNGGDKIDQLIFLGTPQLGSPKAFKALMFGDNMGLGIDILNIDILSPVIVKYISQNMPSVYELIPSPKYIEENGNYIINNLNKKIEPFGLDYFGTKNLMIEKGRNLEMFPIAEDLHNSIDNLDLSGIRSYNFIGCGTKTIGEITLKTKSLWNSFLFGVGDDFDLKYVNGDKTVPLASANKTIGSELFFVKNITHGALPSADGVRQSILSILKDEPVVFGDVIKDNDSSCGVAGKIVSTHSPVELHIYNEEGDHTGPNEDGDIEYRIEGVQYDVLDGEKFAFIPDGVNYKIVTNATDTGGYSFVIKDEDRDDNITATYNWTLIPLTTLKTTGEIWVGPNYPSDEYKVKIDNNGDGEVDKNYPINYDGTQEAENATTRHKTLFTGSISKISNIKENELITSIIREPAQNEEKFVFNNSEIKSNNLKKEILENNDKLIENLENKNIVDIINPEKKINLIWPVIIIFVSILIILAKIFIKL